VVQVFHRALRYYPLNTITPMGHTYLYLHIYVTRKINEPNLGTCYKGSALSDVVEFWIGQYFHLVFEGLTL